MSDHGAFCTRGRFLKFSFHRYPMDCLYYAKRKTTSIEVLRIELGFSIGN